MFVGEKVVSTPQKSYIVVNYVIRCKASRRIGASSWSIIEGDSVKGDNTYTSTSEIYRIWWYDNCIIIHAKKPAPRCRLLCNFSEESTQLSHLQTYHLLSI